MQRLQLPNTSVSLIGGDEHATLRRAYRILAERRQQRLVTHTLMSHEDDGNVERTENGRQTPSGDLDKIGHCNDIPSSDSVRFGV